MSTKLRNFRKFSCHLVKNRTLIVMVNKKNPMDLLLIKSKNHLKRYRLVKWRNLRQQNNNRKILLEN